ncbi:hypothetical protein EDB84DRAFT_1673815 [Lactarius hengduanensis]|nr:hypothetical protein EDB84DRAFT_1673815 [Lactarius hengduanensis]
MSTTQINVRNVAYYYGASDRGQDRSPNLPFTASLYSAILSGGSFLDSSCRTVMSSPSQGYFLPHSAAIRQYASVSAGLIRFDWLIRQRRDERDGKVLKQVLDLSRASYSKRPRSEVYFTRRFPEVKRLKGKWGAVMRKLAKLKRDPGRAERVRKGERNLKGPFGILGKDKQYDARLSLVDPCFSGIPDPKVVILDIRPTTKTLKGWLVV